MKINQKQIETLADLLNSSFLHIALLTQAKETQLFGVNCIVLKKFNLL